MSLLLYRQEFFPHYLKKIWIMVLKNLFFFNSFQIFICQYMKKFFLVYVLRVASQYPQNIRLDVPISYYYKQCCHEYLCSLSLHWCCRMFILRGLLAPGAVYFKFAKYCKEPSSLPTGYWPCSYPHWIMIEDVAHLIAEKLTSHCCSLIFRNYMNQSWNTWFAESENFALKI